MQLGERKSSGLSAALLGCISSLPVKGGKGSVALKSDLADVKHINTLERHSGAIHSASSQHWKKPTTEPESRYLYFHRSSILLCVFHSVMNFAFAVFSIYTGHSLQMMYFHQPIADVQLWTFPS